MNIRATLSELAKSRPIFHSEADFQHSLAWTIHELYPDAELRLEVPCSTIAGTLYIDILVRHRGQLHGVELKYKTRHVQLDISGETYNLQSHVALPLGRYDVLKDLYRVESFAKSGQSRFGAVVFLTNDSAYWARPRSQTDTSVAFSLYEGRSIPRVMNWSETASHGTKKGREQPIHLNGTYSAQWEDYSIIQAKSYSTFRSLIFEVGS